MNEIEPNYRILVVDDVKDIHDDFRKILTPKKNQFQEDMQTMQAALSTKPQEKRRLPAFSIDSACQGTQAVSMVKTSLTTQKPYALAFVDIQMPPGMDGIDTIMKMWQLDPEIQIVICTAYSKYSWEEIFDKLGETDRLFILKKPFDQLEIINLACSLTKKWNLTHMLEANTAVTSKASRSKETFDPTAASSSQKPPGSLKDTIDNLKALSEDLKNNALFKKTDTEPEDPDDLE